MGNPTSYALKTLTWSGKQLIRYYYQPGKNQLYNYTYAYDENGLRTQKVLNGVTTSYYYNGSVLMGMVTGSGNSAIHQLFSYDSSGNVVSVDYSSNGGSTFTTYYYLRNAQNDIVKIIDGNGATVVEYKYDSWGKPISTTGSLSATLGANQPFRYRGYVYDTETGWYYLQSRYYDPSICRFVSADVYLSTGQGVLGHNSYAYCGNNPITRADEGGEFWNFIVGAVAGALISGVAQIVSNVVSGQNWSDGLGVAMVTGAASGLLAASGVGLVGSIAGNAAISMAGNAANQVVRNDGFSNFDAGDMLLDGVIGGIAGAVGGSGMGKSVNLRTLNQNLTRKVFSGSTQLAKQGAKYYLSQTKTLYKKFLIEPMLKAGAASATSFSLKVLLW